MNITPLFRHRRMSSTPRSGPSQSPLATQGTAAPAKRPLAQAPSPATANMGGLLQGLEENFAPKAQPVSGPTLRKGAMGDDVRRLQQLLNAQGGPQLTVDGVLGPRTEAAVRRLQAQRDLATDGIVGPKTWHAIEQAPKPPRAIPVQEEFDRTPRAIPVKEAQIASPARQAGRQTSPISHPSRRATAAERAAHYKNLLSQHGVKVQSGQVHVIGMRGLAPDGARTSSTDGNRMRDANKEGTRYNDSFVVLRPNREGQHDAYLLRGSTYPGQASSSKSPDANGDGTGDVGMMRPGTYRVRPNGEFYGAASYRVRRTNGTTRLPGWRDTNHDGNFSAQERERSQTRGNTVSGILFHQGDAAAPNSTGFQNLSPADFQNFIKAVGGEKASFTYTLLDAGR